MDSDSFVQQSLNLVHLQASVLLLLSKINWTFESCSATLSEEYISTFLKKGIVITHSFFFVLLNLASQVNNNDSVVTIQHLQGNE